MRAPPESLSPITGAPVFMARSMTLQIFFAFCRESEPPKTVKSCANAYAGRPSILPYPVTKPSPGIFWFVMPKSEQSWATSRSSSSNVPSSRSRSSRSRAESLPASCCRLARSGPPPSRAAALRRSSSACLSASFMCAIKVSRASCGQARALPQAGRSARAVSAAGRTGPVLCSHLLDTLFWILVVPAVAATLLSVKTGRRFLE